MHDTQWTRGENICFCDQHVLLTCRRAFGIIQERAVSNISIPYNSFVLYFNFDLMRLHAVNWRLCVCVCVFVLCVWGCVCVCVCWGGVFGVCSGVCVCVCVCIGVLCLECVVV